MVVRLSLLKEKEEEKIFFKLSYKSLLYFCLFMAIISLCSDLYGVCLLSGLRVRNSEGKKQLGFVSEHNARLNSKLKLMSDKQKKEEEKLDYILSGVRGVEILSALTAFTASGIAIDLLKADVDRVVIAGTAESQERISVFEESLKIRGLFASVGELVTTVSDKDGEAETISFSLTCVTESIDKITGLSKTGAESK